jgi:hypothetical protein
MKRLLVVTILAVGLLAVAGSTLVDRHKLAADGNPPPPFPWYVADGNPPPPFPPYPKSKVTGVAVPVHNASPERLMADGNPPPPFPPHPPSYLTNPSTAA